MTRMPVVVAVDGSDSALEATRWGAQAAVRGGSPLRLVHVHGLPQTSLPLSADDQRQWIEALSTNGEHVLREAAAAAAAIGVEVRTDQRVGSAVDVIVDESQRAELVVIGHRGLGGYQRMRLGSVALGVASQAHCPVVVVRSPDPGAGPVVLGVDVTAAGDAAVGFAFARAAEMGTAVVAVRTWLEVEFTDRWTVADPVDAADRARGGLDERLAGWVEKYPDVPVERVVVRDRPARALLARAAGARLLVVGARGPAHESGMGLGSTSQTLVHHAPCPVAVVRPDYRRR